jgi:hypothetical protein
MAQAQAAATAKYRQYEELAAIHASVSEAAAGALEKHRALGNSAASPTAGLKANGHAQTAATATGGA